MTSPRPWGRLGLLAVLVVLLVAGSGPPAVGAVETMVVMAVQPDDSGRPANHR